LNQILARKNPYLYRAKNIETADALVHNILGDFVSSGEETRFGALLEAFALFVCGKTYGGRKSSADGIDIEFEKEGVYYIVAVKSGPNWGNSQQIQRMLQNFSKAKRILQTSAKRKHIEAVNGCCYGIDKRPDKGEYLKLCGQAFWKFISDSETLYTDIIEPLGREAREPSENFQRVYDDLVSKLKIELTRRFCFENGELDWHNIVRFNSEARS
jgi:hypothetical protein